MHAMQGDMYACNLFHKSDKCRDLTRLRYHHIIKCVCDFVMNRSERVIFVVGRNDTGYNSIDQYYTPDFIRCISKLPVETSIVECTFSDFIERLEYSGNIMELANQKPGKNHGNNFSGVKQFAKRHGLNYLSKEYFETIKTKCLLIQK